MKMMKFKNILSEIKNILTEEFLEKVILIYKYYVFNIRENPFLKKILMF